jgi:ligand-binding SRPBCC domain-containing protein
MPVVEETILIKRPRDEVFAFATDPSNVTLYSSNLVEFEKTSEGPVGKGTTYRGVAKVAGKSLRWTSEVAEFEPGRRFVNRSVESPMAWEMQVRYEDDAGDTLIHWRQETDGYSGFFGKLADPLVTRMYARDVKSNLEKLKELLEA